MQVIDSSFHGLFAVFAVQNGCFVLHLAYLNFFPFPLLGSKTVCVCVQSLSCV